MKPRGLEVGGSTGARIRCTKAGYGHAETNRAALCLDYIIIDLSAETVIYLINSLLSKNTKHALD